MTPTTRQGSLALLSVLAVATGLRLFQLDAQLWLDEVSALVSSIRRPASLIVTEWPGVSSHVLYELLAHAMRTIFGESPVALRLPAVFFGVAGIWTAYRVARRVIDPVYAILVSALLAVSYHHVFYSQNARGYTAFIFFFLFTVDLLLRFAERREITPGDGWLYVVVVVLANYSQPFAVFAPMSNVIIGFAVWKLVSADRPFPIRALAKWTAVAAVLTAVLYAPFVPGMLAHAEMNLASDGEGPRAGIAFVMEVLDGLKSAFGGVVGLVVASLLGIAGVALWIRNAPLVAAALILPLVLQALTFTVAGFALHPRYFAPALPVIYMIAAYPLARGVGFVLGRTSLGGSRLVAAQFAAVTAVVLISALPLRRYYEYPKQDFRGAYEAVQELASLDDARVGIQSAGTVYQLMYEPPLTKVDDLAGLQSVEARAATVWVVTTLEGIMRRVQPELAEHLDRRYEMVLTFPGTLGDGDVRVYRSRSTP